MKLKILSLLAAAVLGLAFAATPASADTINFNLTVPNTSSLGPGPYVEVTINLTTSTTAVITFTSLGSYVMGDGTTVGLNVNAATFVASNETQSPGSFKQYNIGSQNINGFGDFNFTIDSTKGFGPGDSSTTVSFTLTNTSGTWATASDVLIANANGSTAVSHVLAPNGVCTTSATCTGFVSNGSEVPEPGSLMLFGTGLLGMAGYLRRKLMS